MPYMQLVAKTREGNSAVLDIYDGVLKFPKRAVMPFGIAGTAHVQLARRRGTFVLFRAGYESGKPLYTGSWKCG
jgi:hypothetical protein